DWTLPLFIVVVGTPLALVFKFWYKKKEDNPSKFGDNGTYVRDDSLYSYDESSTNPSEDNENNKKNNS
ncbi:MAG: hypothetical protein KGH99_02680, partial [Thaumarchaeota archaeon]|nr:hypothetical protein [Nitrososphaerota archaeon]